jgi:hypothetical protein
MRRLALVALVSVLCTACWIQVGVDAQHTGYNPQEHVISSATWASLQEAWTAAVPTQSGTAFAPPLPAVANQFAYTKGFDGILRAFDAFGVTNCSGSPKSCTPLWTADAGGGAPFDTVSDAVSDGRAVFVGGANGTLYAFDAQGRTNCSGSPRMCAPVWTASIGGSVYPPTLIGPKLFVASSSGTVYAFDENGKINCSGAPRVCKPLWSATTGFARSSIGPAPTPAFADPMVIYPSPHGLMAFDGRGTTRCSGSPVVCQPVWQADLGSGDPVGYPVVSGRVVYEALLSGDVVAFDAGGVVGCTGSAPAICSPRWTDRVGGILFGGPAIGPDGTVYAGGDRLASFSSNGVSGCGGSPLVCQPLKTATIGGFTLQPAVVNDIVVLSVTGFNTPPSKLAAFRTGTLTPLATHDIGTAKPLKITNGVTVDLGTVFTGTDDGLLRAWRAHP